MRKTEDITHRWCRSHCSVDIKQVCFIIECMNKYTFKVRATNTFHVFKAVFTICLSISVKPKQVGCSIGGILVLFNNSILILIFDFFRLG